MRRHAARLSILIPAFVTANVAHAYIGPGAGLSAIGSALALLGALLLMIVGFVWYPVKRLMKRRKAAGEPAANRAPDKRAGERGQSPPDGEADPSHSRSRT